MRRAMYRHVDHFTAPLSPTTALGYTDHAGDYFERDQVSLCQLLRRILHPIAAFLDDDQSM